MLCRWVAVKWECICCIFLGHTFLISYFSIDLNCFLKFEIWNLFKWQIKALLNYYLVFKLSLWIIFFWKSPLSDSGFNKFVQKTFYWTFNHIKYKNIDVGSFKPFNSIFIINVFIINKDSWPMGWTQQTRFYWSQPLIMVTVLHIIQFLFAQHWLNKIVAKKNVVWDPFN